MDIVLSKNGVKCAVFKISDVQIMLYLYIYTKVILLKIGNLKTIISLILKAHFVKIMTRKLMGGDL